MFCEEVANQLLDYLSGELSDEMRRLLDNHLSTCSNCAAFVHSYRVTVALGRKLSPKPLPQTVLIRLQSCAQGYSSGSQIAPGP